MTSIFISISSKREGWGLDLVEPMRGNDRGLDLLDGVKTLMAVNGNTEDQV